MIHIIEGHLDDFDNYLGINDQDEIVQLIFRTVAGQNEIDKIESKDRYIYDIGMINGKHRYLAIIIANNGYIINAFPYD